MEKQLTEAAKVAKLCRQYLKEIKVKASVRTKNYAGGDSVTIEVKNETKEVIEKIRKDLSKYKMGNFDGMNDSYEFSNKNENIPQTKFLFVGKY